MPKFSVGRRQFAFGAATVAATALIGPVQAIAQGGAIPQSDPAKPATTLDQQTQAAMAKLSPKAQAEVEMKVSEIFRKYGDRLSDAQKADIHRIMAETQDGLEKMRAFPLENGDQPADAFRAYRREEKI
jgi:secreted PhoX family phosphatase